MSKIRTQDPAVFCIGELVQWQIKKTHLIGKIVSRCWWEFPNESYWEYGIETKTLGIDDTIYVKEDRLSLCESAIELEAVPAPKFKMNDYVQLKTGVKMVGRVVYRSFHQEEKSFYWEYGINYCPHLSKRTVDGTDYRSENELVGWGES